MRHEMNVWPPNCCPARMDQMDLDGWCFRIRRSLQHQTSQSRSGHEPLDCRRALLLASRRYNLKAISAQLQSELRMGNSAAKAHAMPTSRCAGLPSSPNPLERPGPLGVQLNQKGSEIKCTYSPVQSATPSLQPFRAL